MLPLELAGFWLGPASAWDHSLLLLGGRCSATRLLVRCSGAARQPARSGEDDFPVSALIEEVAPLWILASRHLATNSALPCPASTG